MERPASFGRKLVFLALAGIALQVGVYNVFGPWGDFDELAAFERYHPAPPDVLALGDSTYIHVGEADTDRRRLPQMLQTLLPDRHLELIIHPGYHGGVYREFIAYARSAGKLPPVVLVDVNLASFGEGWDGPPSYEFVYERRSLQLHRSRWLAPWVPILSTFRAIDLLEKSPRPPLVQLAWSESVPETPIPFARTLPTQAFAGQFRGTYLRPLERTNRRLVALRETAEILKAADVRTIFYVTPIDYESGTEAVGPQFRSGIERNIAVVRDELARAGCDLYDFSELVPARDFIWHTDEHRPGEHLAQAGREKLAGQLAALIRGGVTTAP